jgi:type II secretory ATPase GspE/PulE/Tfp pilus assembly ATPase PilB-like protein
VASREQLLEAIERGYGPSETEAVGTTCFVDPAFDFERDVTTDNSPVARLVDLIIAEAMDWGATEVRIDPENDCLHVSYRVGGSWVDRDSPPRRLLDLIVARIEFLAAIPHFGQQPREAGRIRGNSRGRSFDLAVLIRRTGEGPELVLTFLPCHPDP